jgi:hypothetical protein
MGLAVAHMIRTVVAVLFNRKKIQLYWPHSIWCLNILLYLVNFWWFVFYWSRLQSWNYFLFLLLISYAILLSLLALILLPEKVHEGYNFKVHFYHWRKWFFGLSTLLWFVDMTETYIKHITGVREMHRFYLPFNFIVIIMTLTGIMTDNKKFHAFFSIFWFIWVMGYITMALIWLK